LQKTRTQDTKNYPPPSQNNQPTQIKTPLTTITISKNRENHPDFTVDKAPLQVDNSIKQGCNASLQGCFEIKPRGQKPLQGGFSPKQGGFVSLQGRFRVKPGEQMFLSVGYF